MVVGQFSGGAGGGVVDKNDCLLRLFQRADTEFIELTDGKGTGAILDESQVDIDNDEAAGTSVRP